VTSPRRARLHPSPTPEQTSTIMAELSAGSLLPDALGAARVRPRLFHLWLSRANNKGWPAEIALAERYRALIVSRAMAWAEDDS